MHEWLGLLHLSEYADTLTRQGYTDTNSITDITWEDLEDIGIKKLGEWFRQVREADDGPTPTVSRDCLKFDESCRVLCRLLLITTCLTIDID